MMRKKNRLHSKRGVTLVELVVVMAILSICSGMLVGVVSGSVDRYSKSTDIENSKNQATNFERMYKRCVENAYSVSVSDYNQSSFSPQDKHYYLILNPTDKTASFLMAYEDDNTSEVKITNMITCKDLGTFSQKVYTVGKDDNQKYADYKLSVISSYEPNVTYDYSGTITMNNNGAGSDFDQDYILDSKSMTNPVCIDFSMTK